MKQVKLRVEEGPNGKRIYLGDEYPEVYFTVREAELAQLLENYKYREIAKILKVSRRTIEYYCTNIKKKMRCRNKRELIYIIKHSGLLEQLKERVDISQLLRQFKSGQDNEAEVENNNSKDASSNSAKSKYHSQQELTEITSLIINQLEPSLNEVGNG